MRQGVSPPPRRLLLLRLVPVHPPLLQPDQAVLRRALSPCCPPRGPRLQDAAGNHLGGGAGRGGGVPRVGAGQPGGLRLRGSVGAVVQRAQLQVHAAAGGAVEAAAAAAAAAAAEAEEPPLCSRSG